MKSRMSFVANSSSTAFIVGRYAYASVFKLAIAMIKCRDFGRDDQKLIRTIRSSEFDPDTSISFDTMNNRTFISLVDNCYHVQTCQNHIFDLDGISYGQVRDIESEFYFWFPEYDLFGKPIKKADGEPEYCLQHSEELIMLKDSEKIVCPNCYWQKHLKFKNISKQEKFQLLKRAVRRLDPELLITLIDPNNNEALWKEIEKKVDD